MAVFGSAKIAALFFKERRSIFNLDTKFRLWKVNRLAKNCLDVFLNFARHAKDAMFPRPRFDWGFHFYIAPLRSVADLLVK